MKKPSPVDVTGVVAIGSITGATVANLARHDVGVLVIMAVALSMLSSGGWLLMVLTKGLTTEVYRCSVEGCSVEIRATRNHTPERLAVLRDMATDHTRHGSVGA
jgi:hypothetical protein